MKTVTKSKPTSAKTLKAMMAKPIGVEPIKPAAQSAKVEAPKQVPAKESTQTAKGKGLWYFQTTPAGRLLRAYFIAFIQAQTGKLATDKVFKLWPACNIRGHLDTKKIIRKDAGYALTAAGYNYFTDPAQAADPDMLAKFAAAIRTGNKPDCYKYQMSQSDIVGAK